MSLIIFVCLIGITIIIGIYVQNSLSSFFAWNPADEFQIEDLLESYNRLDEFKSELLKCSICEEIISHLNIGPLIESENDTQLDILCNDSECIIEYFDSQESNDDLFQ